MSNRNFSGKVVGMIVIFAFLNMLSWECGGPAKLLRPDIPDILLTGNTDRDAVTLQSSFELLQDAAQNPGKSINVGIPNKEIIKISTANGGPVNYRHPVMTYQGQTVHIVVSGLVPTLRLVDAQGNSIIGRNGKKVEVPVITAGKLSGTKDVAGSVGRIIALAFVIWVGATIGAGVLGAVAYIASLVFVLGVVIAAVGIIAPIFGFAGWTPTDVFNVFMRTIGEIVRNVTDLVNSIRILLGLLSQPVRGENFLALFFYLKLSAKK